jgi:hypothetical protein
MASPATADDSFLKDLEVVKITLQEKKETSTRALEQVDELIKEAIEERLDNFSKF